MKLSLAMFLFFIFSLLIVFITIEHNASNIEHKYLEKIQLTKLQKISRKQYTRTRKSYLPNRSYLLAVREIAKVLLDSPITFKANGCSPVMKSTLIKIVNIINHIKEDVVLSISSHTDSTGSAQHNLLLSQKRADCLKAYFRKRVNLPLVVAIGYGEAFSLEKSLIEINLKRIK